MKKYLVLTVLGLSALYTTASYSGTVPSVISKVTMQFIATADSAFEPFPQCFLVCAPHKIKYNGVIHTYNDCMDDENTYCTGTPIMPNVMSDPITVNIYKNASVSVDTHMQGEPYEMCQHILTPGVYRTHNMNTEITCETKKLGLNNYLVTIILSPRRL